MSTKKGDRILRNYDGYRIMYGKTFNKQLSEQKSQLYPGPDSIKAGKVAGKTFIIRRNAKLDYWGNPLYTAYVLDKKGNVAGKSKTSSGNPSNLLEEALEQTGVRVKHTKHKNKNGYWVYD